MWALAGSAGYKYYCTSSAADAAKDVSRRWFLEVEGAYWLAPTEIWPYPREMDPSSGSAE